MGDDVRIRAATPGDRGFVLHSWWRSAVCELRLGRRASRMYRIAMEPLLARCELRIVCLADEPAFVLAWAAVEGDCVHWAYTVTPYRGNGLVRSLLKGKGIHVTSQDAVSVSWLKFDPRRL